MAVRRLVPRSLVPLVFFLAASATCGQGQETLPADAVAVSVEHVYGRDWSAFDRSLRLVVREQPEFDALWRTGMVWLQSPPPPPPQDFRTTMLIVAAMGRQRTGGYSIRIESVYRSQGQLFVRVRQVSPGENCLVTQAISFPADVVRVPRSPEPATFVERETSGRC